MSDPGSAVDIPRLDALVREQVLEPFDHNNLNEQVEAFHAAWCRPRRILGGESRRLKQNWGSRVSR